MTAGGRLRGFNPGKEAFAKAKAEAHMKSFIIKENDAGQRLDKFLTKAVPRLPKNLLYKYIRLKRIKLNGGRCQISDRLSVGDCVTLYINDEFFESRGELDFLSCPPNMDIVYEDSNILIVNKPCGLVVHDDDSQSLDTLLNRLKRYLYDKGEYIPQNEASFTPALCNRLDRNTQGLVICAKNAESLRTMNLAIRKRWIEKRYLCVVIGEPVPEECVIEGYLVKRPAENIVEVSKRELPGSKRILTGYRVLEKRAGLSLCEIELITGRTHQIRAHMSFIGCPLLGDGKYGVNDLNRKYGVKTQALCAYRLEFKAGNDYGSLGYLSGREFKVDNIWFLSYFPSAAGYLAETLTKKG